MLGKELNKTKKARQKDDPQTSVVQSPEAIPTCQVCSKEGLKTCGS